MKILKCHSIPISLCCFINSHCVFKLFPAPELPITVQTAGGEILVIMNPELTYRYLTGG